MNATRLVKLAPTAILLAFLGYATFSLQAALPGESEKQAELAKGFDLMLHDIVAASRTGPDQQGPMRDPFLPVVPHAAVDVVAPDIVHRPESDALAGIVAGLSLDATFLQGSDQLAIINGRIYNKGQHLVLGGDDKPHPTLVVVFVKPTSVILRGAGKNYVLGYPEQLGRKPNPAADADTGAAGLDTDGQGALFRRLLDSPLGALGKSLIGDVAKSRRPADSRAASRRKTTGTPGSGLTPP